MLLRRRKSGGKSYIFDVFRGKWVIETPEESVRQSFCNHLCSSLGYPLLSIAIEKGLKLNGTTRRFDTVVYKGGLPIMLVEFKAPDVTIDSETMLQAISYNSVLQAGYIIITNSKTTYCVKLNLEEGTHTYLEEIPCFSEL